MFAGFSIPNNAITETDHKEMGTGPFFFIIIYITTQSTAFLQTRNKHGAILKITFFKRSRFLDTFVDDPNRPSEPIGCFHGEN